MFMRSIVAAAVFSLIALSCHSQGYNPDNVVRGVCRPDGCDDFTIASIDLINRGYDGALMRARVEVYHSSFRGRVSRGFEERHVFCSSTRPAIVESAFGKHVAFFLAPLERHANRGIPSIITRFILQFATASRRAGPRLGTKHRLLSSSVTKSASMRYVASIFLIPKRLHAYGRS